MYSTVQCIGYFQACTCHPNTWKQGTPYWGLDDDKTDIVTRCKLVIKAIQEAYTQANNDSTSLKIFMLPELYFHSKRGAYPLELLSMIPDQIKLETNQPQYSHWLFVLGSAIGILKHGSTQQIEIFNISYVHKGGPNKMDQNGNPYQHMVYKEYKSTDFRTQTMSSNPTYMETKEITPEGDPTFLPYDAVKNVIIGPGAPVEDFVNQVHMVEGSRNDPTKALTPKVFPPGSKSLSEYSHKNIPNYNTNTRPLLGECVFKMGNFTFGLEICKDHKNGRLINFYEETKEERNINIQLVPAAGTGICQESTALTSGGLIFNVNAVINQKYWKTGPGYPNSDELGENGGAALMQEVGSYLSSQEEVDVQKILPLSQSTLPLQKQVFDPYWIDQGYQGSLWFFKDMAPTRPGDDW